MVEFNELDDRVITIARKHLEAYGVEGMTVRALASEANISPTTLYNRYGGKDNLVSLVLQQEFLLRVDMQLSKKRKNSKPLDLIQELLDVQAKAVLDQPLLAFSLVDMHFKQKNCRNIPELNFNAIRDRFVPFLESLQKDGQISKWVNLNMLAGDIIERYFGAILRLSRNEINSQNFLDSTSYICLSALAAFAEPPLDAEIRPKLKKIVRKLAHR